MEKVSFTAKVFDNFLELIPENGIQDNSIYEIKIKYLKEENGTKEIKDFNFKLCTAMTPCYANITDVTSLLGNDIEVPDDIILYHIREASRYADYIKDQMKNYTILKIKDKSVEAFQKKQLTKYKAAYECLLRFYMNVATESGIEGTLGDITFKNGDLPDISDLIKTFKDEIEKWSKALQGLDSNIYAHTKSGVKSSTRVSYRNSIDGSKTPEYSRRQYT